MPKININIPIVGELRQLVADENNVLSRSIDSNYIDFSETSPHSPHVSLYMGEIDLGESQLKLFSAIQSNITIFSGLEIASSKISITDPDRRGNAYVFIDVEPEFSLLQLKKDVWELTGDLFSSPRWFYLEETPHVTIGCVTDSKAALERFYESRKLQNITQLVSEIRVSEVGPRGTCVGKINAWKVS